ncbi:2-dehydro-3-deoxyphosphogluconate aldolase [Planococcus antarcticus DSM 14505]|uniref:2-dehydro-3-deoxyphosphogluconate aldolase n=1 Tax=Planococcus antarcticus DSM 14505 TaxID=1185653 RepID=A0AA87II42_9BACL|nr:bifunctional 2-keto-4-hydroxyglutarate aldolase/2-keto-3-deoxy-6-phosphogluconate aldolase [Planococcus antarcticus]EIM05266.1 2-dehydro-3-deoxyphosphogluconate aldolase [Planococcus antarcticus DSM 14505]
MLRYSILSQLESAKVIAVIRGGSAKEAIELSRAAIEGGIRAIELTYTTPQVEKVFDALAQEDVLLGAGSVLDTETARHAILAGAKFIVSPSYMKEISPLCNRYSIPYLPGCTTLREMVKSLEGGSDIIKLFPANNIDPSFIKSINGPLPNVRVMPTGGINLNNMSDWLTAGAVAVGIGSDLNKAYASGGFAAAVELSRKYMEKVR